MSVDTSTIAPKKRFAPREANGEEIFYAETDESIMPEGITHFLLSVRLTATLLAHFADRRDAKIFGDLMFYYEKGNPGKFVSPDLMICFGMETMPSRVYKLWEEKIVPSVIVELASESTWDKDLTTKFALYERLGVKEYYIFDVEYKCLREPLMAYHRRDDEFVKVEIAQGRVFSSELGLELVDTGETLRLFNPATGQFLMTTEEMAARLAQLEAQNK